MWKWILLIMSPLLILAIFEETSNFIVRRITRQKVSKKKKAKKQVVEKQEKQRQSS
ncbi:hypothetical protein [Bacillus niameyensis]|uniref:hypothetical protein n=1 Tax=Bacillus niameyensis TaxID=1522308 RepID=UPI000A5FF5D8|nr:hypothetical protein [Bacillus niameyensis]